MNKKEFESKLAAIDAELEKLEKMLLLKEEEKETRRNENYEPLFVFGTCTGIRQINTRALGRPNRCLYTRKG